MKRTALRRKTSLKSRTPLKRSSFKRNKFKAKPVHDLTTGETFDSKGEHGRYRFLQMLEKGGAISELTLHPKIVLIPKTKSGPGISWKVDYSYIEDGRTVYEDYKPRPVDKREVQLFKLWKHFGPGLLRITKDEKGSTKRTINGGSDSVKEG